MQGNSTFSKEAAVGLSEKCSFGKLREASQKGDSVCMLTIPISVCQAGKQARHSVGVARETKWAGTVQDSSADRSASHGSCLRRLAKFFTGHKDRHL